MADPRPREAEKPNRPEGVVETPDPRRAIYRPDIQGLRALAVLLVVAFHAELPISGGFIGVDVFFVISGFVITAILLRELESKGRLSFANFYSRRARRLLPALALVLVVVAVIGTFLLGPMNLQPQTAKTGVATSLLAANAQLYKAPSGYFTATTVSNPLVHTWSLSVEEQFYLLFPLLLVLGWRTTRRMLPRTSPRRGMAVVLTGIVMTSFVLSLLLTPLNGKLSFYASPTRAWEFGAGGLVALAVPLLGRIGHRSAMLLGIAGATMIFVGAWRITSGTPFPGTAGLLPVTGTAGLIAAGTGGAPGITRLLSARPLVRLGDVSYGWYLWHWPALVFAGILWSGANHWILAAAAVASLVPTWLSYRYLEQPIRAKKHLTGVHIIPLAMACLLIPIGANVALLRGADAIQARSDIRALQAQLVFHADSTRGCDGADPRTIGNQCTWPIANPRGTVVLVGDSNAGQFTETVATAANSLGFVMVARTKSDCPFVDLIVQFPHLSGYDPATCRYFDDAVLAELHRMRPALVVIAASSTDYLTGSGTWLQSPTGGGSARTAPAKALLWEQGLTRVLTKLQKDGIRGLVVNTIPQYPIWDVASCPAFRLYFSTLESCGDHMSLQKAHAMNRISVQVEQIAVGRVAQASDVDFSSDLCPRGHCSTNQGSFWVYRNGTHLSVAGALRLTSRFADLIRLHACEACNTGNRP